MHRVDTATAVNALPAVGAPGPNPNSFWTSGNPGAGTPATNGDGDFFNMFQEELAALLAAVGIAQVKGVFNQVLTAILVLIGARGGPTATRIYAGASPLNIGLTDTDVAVTMGAPAALQVNLPAGAIVGFEITIKDLGTNFFAHNATVVPPSGTIDGEATSVMAVQNGFRTFKKYGTAAGNDIWGTK